MRPVRSGESPVALARPRWRNGSVASTDGQLRLFVLPAYSPQLNPDEWVWKNVKHDRVGRTSVTGPDDFKTRIVSALRRLQKMPHIVRAFFADPTCATSQHDQSPLTNELFSNRAGPYSGLRQVQRRHCQLLTSGHTTGRLCYFEKIPETWPWARELEAAFLAAFALTAPHLTAPDPASLDR